MTTTESTLRQNAKDLRIKCPCCGIPTWMTDYTAFMRDHDRPDGKVCRAAQRLITKADTIIAATTKGEQLSGAFERLDAMFPKESTRTEIQNEILAIFKEPRG